jgi:hypothetical protein
MSGICEGQIVDAEDRLIAAMLNSDAKAFDELLAPNLLFTNHLGQFVAAHSGTVA